MPPNRTDTKSNDMENRPSRSYKPLTTIDLASLRRLGIEEGKAFFRRNPHLKTTYGSALIAICLCQGAASHLLNPSVGVKDYDVWHFYVQNRRVPFPYRAHYRSHYKGRRVDFLKRCISERVVSGSTSAGESVIAYLMRRDTATKKRLLTKAIIGLHPKSIFGKVLWRGEP
jgi:hypothetical protein